jgi:hypothetical protein
MKQASYPRSIFADQPDKRTAVKIRKQSLAGLQRFNLASELSNRFCITPDPGETFGAMKKHFG